MKHTYIPKGVCSRQITVEVEDGIIKSVAFVGGCAGNTAGVSKLCVGRKVDDVIELLRGTQCRNGTSCPDQLSYALEETKELVGA